MTKCVWVDGALLRVENRFDETPGSEDMTAAAALVETMRNYVPPGRDEFVTHHGQVTP